MRNELGCRQRRGLDLALVNRLNNHLDAGSDAQFPFHVLDVKVHGFIRNVQYLADLPIRLSVGNPLEDFDLPCGQVHDTPQLTHCTARFQANRIDCVCSSILFPHRQYARSGGPEKPVIFYFHPSDDFLSARVDGNG